MISLAKVIKLYQEFLSNTITEFTFKINVINAFLHPSVSYYYPNETVFISACSYILYYCDILDFQINTITSRKALKLANYIMLDLPNSTEIVRFVLSTIPATNRVKRTLFRDHKYRTLSNFMFIENLTDEQYRDIAIQYGEMSLELAEKIVAHLL